VGLALGIAGLVALGNVIHGVCRGSCRMEPAGVVHHRVGWVVVNATPAGVRDGQGLLRSMASAMDAQ
jgi:hypothetical protein